MAAARTNSPPPLPRQSPSSRKTATRSQSITSGTARATRSPISSVLVISARHGQFQEDSGGICLVTGVIDCVGRIESGRGQLSAGVERALQLCAEEQTDLVDGKDSIVAPSRRDRGGDYFHFADIR